MLVLRVSRLITLHYSESYNQPHFCIVLPPIGLSNYLNSKIGGQGGYLIISIHLILGRLAAPQTSLQFQEAALPRPPAYRGAAPPGPLAIPGGCVPRTPCNTEELRPTNPLPYWGLRRPNPLQFQGAVPLEPPFLDN